MTANPTKINKKSIVYEIKSILEANQYKINDLLEKGKDKIKQINQDTDMIEKGENVNRVMVILEKEGIRGTNELKIILNTF